MNKFIFLLPILFSSFTFAEAPSLDSMAFAAKQQINKDMFKKPKYEQGESFALGSTKTAYRLYFSGKYKGRNAVMQINCKANNKTGEIDYCKPTEIK